MRFLRPPVIIGALPVTLTNGTTADATQVMSDFNWIVNQVNANAAPLANTALTNANNNFTVVQTGVAATSGSHFPIASQVQNNVFLTLSSTLGTNSLTSRCAALAISSYAVGQPLQFTPSQTNTGPASMTVDTAPTLPILFSGQALAGGELKAGLASVIVPDGTLSNFHLQANAGASVPYSMGTAFTAGATVNLNLANGDYPVINGTGTITAITLAPGREVLTRFSSSAALTHSTTLQLLGSTSYRTGVNDLIRWRGEPGGVARQVERSVNSGVLVNWLTGGNVSLNVMGQYFNGPTLTLGPGIWIVAATLSVTDNVGSNNFAGRLTDGVTIAASCFTRNFATASPTPMSMIGVFINPVGPVTAAVAGTGSANGIIVANGSGDNKDSQIVAWRVG